MQILFGNQSEKEFENRYTFAEVMIKSQVPCFLTHSVDGGRITATWGLSFLLVRYYFRTAKRRSLSRSSIYGCNYSSP